VDTVINHVTQGSFEPLPDDETQDKQDMSETEFQAKQEEVAEKSPGKKAVKDQDIVEAKKRGVKVKKK